MDQGYFCLAYCLCSLHANLLVQSQMHAKKKNVMAYLGLDTLRNI